jgi:hypothetical protein
VYHASIGSSSTLILNSNAAAADYGNNITNVTSTSFDITNGSDSNANGDGYICYIFASNAGGFGLNGTDNIISCGATGGGNVAVIDLGYEPQFLLYRSYTTTDNWHVIDNIRGASINTSANGKWEELFPNLQSLETTVTGSSGNPNVRFVANGFQLGAISGTAIYIAIRRGPMKVPQGGTAVFSPIYSNPGTVNTPQTTGFPVDMQINRSPSVAAENFVVDRLRGVNTTVANNSWPYLYTNSTANEDTSTGLSRQWTNTTIGSISGNQIYLNFGRAPTFFDEVCFTGDGTSNRSVRHNLGAIPELFITKRRSSGGSGDVNWGVYSKSRPSPQYNLILNSTTAWYDAGTNGWFGTGTLSATLFPAGNAAANFGNLADANYVVYLFATCPGVSKIGEYTGTGAAQSFDCGLYSGARFVLIKRTDISGDWWVYDSARGLNYSNDPYFFLNTSGAQVTGTNYVDTFATGFTLTDAAPSGLNASGGTYIFLAIA